MKTWLLLAPLTIGLCAATSHAQAVPVFNSPAFSAFAPVPGAWRLQGSAPLSTVGYGVMFNITTVSRELMVPLSSQSTGAAFVDWTASVDVGGTLLGPLNPLVCTLYAVAQGEILASSGPQFWTSPVMGVLTMTVSHTPCTSAFIDCSVPPQAWVGNAVWVTAPSP